MLALLAASPGRVFTRDEILDAVWGHRHVTQSVLNRIMSLLRQALGEDAQHPRMLHTVYGVGYRFDLPAPAPTAGAAVPDVAAAGLLPPRRRKAWPVAAAIAGLLAVLPFADLSRARDQEYLADGLAEDILNQLAQSQSLRVVGRTSSFSPRAGTRTCARSAASSASTTCWKAACAATATSSGSPPSWSVPTTAPTCGRKPTRANCATSSPCRKGSRATWRRP